MEKSVCFIGFEWAANEVEESRLYSLLFSPFVECSNRQTINFEGEEIYQGPFETQTPGSSGLNFNFNERR